MFLTRVSNFRLCPRAGPMWTVHLSDAHRRDVVNAPEGWEIPYS